MCVSWQENLGMDVGKAKDVVAAGLRSSKQWMYRFERFYALLFFFPWMGSIIIVVWHWSVEWSTQRVTHKAKAKLALPCLTSSCVDGGNATQDHKELLWLKLSLVRGAVVSISGEQTKLLLLVSLQTLSLSDHILCDSCANNSTNRSFISTSQLKHEAIRCNALPLNFLKLSEAFDSFNRGENQSIFQNWRAKQSGGRTTLRCARPWTGIQELW